LNRKLLVLDIVLGAGVIYGGIQLHNVLDAAKARQARMPGPPPKAAPVPGLPPLPRQPAVVPAGYQQVAVNTLFDPSRTPTVPLDPPPPPPKDPDPPPLPSFHGMMNFGDPQGPVALITEHDTPGHEEVHAGEAIGAFKLVSFDRQEMTLEWHGKVIHKRLNEGGSEPPKARASTEGGPPPVPLGVIPGVASDTPAVRSQETEKGPGSDLTDTLKQCQPGDSSPAGSVSGGFIKEVRLTPMGSQCDWRAVGK
jgi:hypothetical protein